jgi:uncharacterized protein
MQRTILWHERQDLSTEYCTITSHHGGTRFTGIVLQPVENRPLQVRYLVDVDEQWRTRDVEIDLETLAAASHLHLMADGNGTWRRDGEIMADLAGCLDVDLGITPATNTLPIRRLDLQPGEGADIMAAWVRFPDLHIQRQQQHYDRLTDDRYRYQSGDFTAELAIDPDGIVQDYASAWKVIAQEG